ncbi:MAG: fibronectin type III domain-containing protein [Deltaproteobacteria bacterium]|nr:fibronectin type III domain-containing protein [Deltaproteobacteria bacterium]
MKPVIFSSTASGKPGRSAVFSALKIITLIFLLSFFLTPSGFALHLTLQWDPNVDEELAGYIVYYGTASGHYRYDVDIGDQTSCTISGLAEGTRYYFAVTAYDEEGNESIYSREIVYPATVSDSSSGGGSNGDGSFSAVGCFISSAAGGRWSPAPVLSFLTVILAGLLGLLIYRRVLT